jgi:O-antigen/teichoic acid export membrane protein
MQVKIKSKLDRLASDEGFSEILTGSVWALCARVLAAGMGLVVSIMIARLYGAEMMGIVSLIKSFVLLPTIFALLGSDSSILRLIPEHVSKFSAASAYYVYRKTQSFVVCISAVTGSAVALSSGFIANEVFSKPHLSYYVELAGIFVLARCLMELNTQAVRGLRLIRSFALMQVLPQLIMVVLLCAATLLFSSPDIPVYAQLAAWGASGVAGVWIMQVGFRKRMSLQEVVHRTSLRQILSISFPMFLAASMSFLSVHAGVIMLAIFRSDSEVGYYSAALKLATVTAFVLAAINSIAAPKFCELFHDDRTEELFRVARKSTKLMFWTTAPILLVVLLLGKPLLSALFGKEFSAAYPALVLLALGQFVHSASGSTGHFMNMTGHEKVFRNIVLVAAVLNVGMNLVLIPALGICGAAISSMVSISMWNICVLVFVKRKFGRTIAYLPGLPGPGTKRSGFR